METDKTTELNQTTAKQYLSITMPDEHIDWENEDEKVALDTIENRIKSILAYV